MQLQNHGAPSMCSSDACAGNVQVDLYFTTNCACVCVCVGT